MQPRDPKSTGASGRSPLPGSEFLATPLGGTMDVPPNAAADTFAEEMALGTEQPSASPTDRIREDLPVERSSAPTSSSGSPAPTERIASATDAVTDKVSGATKAVTDKVSSATEAVTGKVSSATEVVTDKAPAVAGRVKEWVSAHPLVAVGAGLIGGIILGGSGGGSSHHHHYHGDGRSQGHTSTDDHSTAGGSTSSGHSLTSEQHGGGLLGMIQQTGLLETITQSAERFMKMANDQASDLARQRVPGFQEHLSQKQGPPTQTPAQMTGTVPPTMPRSQS